VVKQQQQQQYRCVAGEAGVMKVEVLLNQIQSLNQQLTQLTIYTTTPRRRSPVRHGTRHEHRQHHDVGRQYAMAHDGRGSANSVQCSISATI